MVPIDLCVALRLHLKVHKAVTRDLLHHVGQERQRRFDIASARSVELEPNNNIGLSSASLDSCSSTHANLNCGRPAGPLEMVSFSTRRAFNYHNPNDDDN
jgi:hypothetical protein